MQNKSNKIEELKMEELEMVSGGLRDGIKGGLIGYFVEKVLEFGMEGGVGSYGSSYANRNNMHFKA